MEPWKTTLQPAWQALRLLTTDPEGNELLKARLPSHPDHPRALLTLLEGLALWCGSPLSAAISAAPRADRSCVEGLFGGGLWPVDSALVHFTLTDLPGRRRTVPGVGDFRQLRLTHRRRA